jgi:hypothetical protein
VVLAVRGCRRCATSDRFSTHWGCCQQSKDFVDSRLLTCIRSDYCDTQVAHGDSAGRLKLDGRELRKPLFAMSCAFGRKIYRSHVPLFTASARSATINHNNLATCELCALILGTQRGGLESEFLLRARRGSEADRRRDGDRRSRTAQIPQFIHRFTISPFSQSPLALCFALHQPSPT